MKIEFFKPSNKVLEMICFEKSISDLRYFYEVYPRGDGRFNEDLVGFFLNKIYSSMESFYKISFNPELLGRQEIYGVAGEVFKNCYDHGPKDKEILFGLFLGNKGVCYGFCDSGDYFKDDKIKFQYEHKKEITEFDPETISNEVNCRLGVNENIYPNTDYLEVDSKKGILYCVQLKNSIIHNGILV